MGDSTNYCGNQQPTQQPTAHNTQLLHAVAEENCTYRNGEGRRTNSPPVRKSKDTVQNRRRKHTPSEMEEGRWTLNSTQTLWEEQQRPNYAGETNKKQKSWIKTTAMKHTSRNRALEAVLPARCTHNLKDPRLVREEHKQDSQPARG